MRAPANILNLLLLSLLAGLDPSQVGAGRAPPRTAGAAAPRLRSRAGGAGPRTAYAVAGGAAGSLRGEAGARPWLCDRPGGRVRRENGCSRDYGLPGARRGSAGAGGRRGDGCGPAALARSASVSPHLQSPHDPRQHATHKFCTRGGGGSAGPTESGPGAVQRRRTEAPAAPGDCTVLGRGREPQAPSGDKFA